MSLLKYEKVKFSVKKKGITKKYNIIENFDLEDFFEDYVRRKKRKPTVCDSDMPSAY